MPSFSQNRKNNSLLAKTQTIQKQSLGLFELKFKRKRLELKRCKIFGLKILILNTFGLQIRKTTDFEFQPKWEK